MLLEPEKENIESYARLILTAARTAPKAKGEDDIVTGIVENNEIDILAVTMEEISDKKGQKFEFFKRDAKNVRDADCVILIGLKKCGPLFLNCGACGFQSCEDMLATSKVDNEYIGPNCSIKYIDLGLSIGSAVSKAKDLCVDNRVLYTGGVAAIRSGLLEVDMAYAIPLKVSGKNIFFDRK
ncbi:ferredoxin domain-containing protein [Methanosalsum natronophilum]|uniref:ferredoxin domain-containing protein n=1 Tax=Methanosalsum natronophilum TaxID=768733 RepID=UPI002169BBA4|nr:DUF2148 domain-containing protein [Methanosalsum natronophilum]MCS3924859.1 putative ferredoxin-like protein [Methanosalsum natronophilum]